MGSFGTILKEWRTIRRYSQLGLALEADISARHLSFLESGRANPSKSMILRLSQALAMPRPIANQAMQAAGFAPAFPDIAAESNDLAPIRKAVERMLAAHDPFPGIAVDRHWNIVSANRGGEMLMAFTPPDTKKNLIEILITTAKSGLIENWQEVALLSLMRLRNEIMDLGGDPILSEMADRLAASASLKNTDISSINLDQVVIPTIICLGNVRLSLFSTIAQFGSVQDVRAGEIRIELMYPHDAATENWFETVQ